VTEAPCATEEKLAPIEICDGALLTTSGVVTLEPANTESPEYVAEIVSVPTGAAEEGHEAVPVVFDTVAVQSDVEPVENATDPVGVVDNPVTFVVTVAE
jgi:hypothetical protein